MAHNTNPIIRNTVEKLHGYPSRFGTARRDEFGRKLPGEFDGGGRPLDGHPEARNRPMSGTYQPTNFAEFFAPGQTGVHRLQQKQPAANPAPAPRPEVFGPSASLWGEPLQQQQQQYQQQQQIAAAQAAKPPGAASAGSAPAPAPALGTAQPAARPAPAPGSYEEAWMQNVHSPRMQRQLDMAINPGAARDIARAQQTQEPVWTHYGPIAVNDWRERVKRNHPEIGMAGSEANKAFVSAYRASLAPRQPNADGSPVDDTTPDALAAKVMQQIHERRAVKGPSAPAASPAHGAASADQAAPAPDTSDTATTTPKAPAPAPAPALSLGTGLNQASTWGDFLREPAATEEERKKRALATAASPDFKAEL